MATKVQNQNSGLSIPTNGSHHINGLTQGDDSSSPDSDSNQGNHSASQSHLPGDGCHGNGKSVGEEWLCAESLEQEHVHEVYEQTAHHFRDVRYRAWPKVRQFLSSLEPGTLVADVGCGHGKYLHINKGAYKLGCDRSAQLADIAASHGHQVAVCDNLRLPYRDGCFDVVISIGVIHHFTTPHRRALALRELARILRPSGKLMVYVWAMEQRHRTFKAQDVLVPWNLKVKPPRNDARREGEGWSNEEDSGYDSLRTRHRMWRKHRPDADSGHHSIRNSSLQPGTTISQALEEKICHSTWKSSQVEVDVLKRGHEQHEQIRSLGSREDAHPNILTEIETKRPPNSTMSDESVAQNAQCTDWKKSLDKDEKNNSFSFPKPLAMFGKSRAISELSGVTADSYTEEKTSKVPQHSVNNSQDRASPESPSVMSFSDTLRFKFQNLLNNKAQLDEAKVTSRLGQHKDMDLHKATLLKTADYHDLLQYIMTEEAQVLGRTGSSSRPPLEHSHSASEVEGFAVRQFPSSSQPRLALTKQSSLESALMRKKGSEGGESSHIPPSARTNNTNTIHTSSWHNEVSHAPAQAQKNRKCLGASSETRCSDIQLNQSDHRNGTKVLNRLENNSGESVALAKHEGCPQNAQNHSIAANDPVLRKVHNIAAESIDFKNKDPSCNGDCNLLGKCNRDNIAINLNRSVVESSASVPEEELTIRDSGLLNSSAEGDDVTSPEVPKERKHSLGCSSDSDQEWLKTTATAIATMQSHVTLLQQSGAHSCCNQRNSASQLSQDREASRLYSRAFHGRAYSDTSSISSVSSMSSDTGSETSDSEDLQTLLESSNATMSTRKQELPLSPVQSEDDLSPQQGETLESASNTGDTVASPEAQDAKHKRYYHVFREGELVSLVEKHVEDLHVIDSYYDHANWCVVAEKVQVWKI